MRRNAQAGMLPYPGLDIRGAENLISKVIPKVISKGRHWGSWEPAVQPVSAYGGWSGLR